MTETTGPDAAARAAQQLTRPSEDDVAAYVMYLATKKGAPLVSITAAVSAIADRIKYAVTSRYDPCKGPLLRAMLQVVTPMVPQSKQKKELGWDDMERIRRAIEADGRKGSGGSKTCERDSCMFGLAYHTFLRASEVIRMNRGDVTFTPELMRAQDGTQTLVTVMRVHVNRMCKNDTESKGHERIIVGKSEAQRRNNAYCVVQAMAAYKNNTEGRGATADSPLFPRTDGGRMSPDTPRGRLHFWTGQAGIAGGESHGFHSLRAGGATAAAEAGVEERLIKQHGNWKSDAVRLYIRPGLEERAKAGNALGQRTVSC